ncbi:MAG: hypothetical protein A3G20_00020 [Acidobacteria bacterium RIFCSPLOWO2_12_FULL_59_11]|nr:MAG: hypothetical protein A3G20_00020 [Acidobacteria bacterium RIFCSPLOWO2_12_FULL_59_11]
MGRSAPGLSISTVADKRITRFPGGRSARSALARTVICWERLNRQLANGELRPGADFIAAP